MAFLVYNQSFFPKSDDTEQAEYAWRTEPEIDSDRQQFLTTHLATTPDIKQGIYPFKDVKLTRADIEWLLVTHEQGHGPIDWSDIQQRERQGLDLRGTDLRGANLQRLPLTCMRGGLTKEEWNSTTLEQHALAGVHLERADLSEAHLERALLRGAYLGGSTMRAAYLQEVTLFQAHLEGAYLRAASMGQANLRGAHLEGAYLRRAFLAGADLRHVIFDTATNIENIILTTKKTGCALLTDVHWGDVNLSIIDWRQVAPLGDETRARSLPRRSGNARDKQRRLDIYRAAVRANRQLANAMRAQGMNEEAIPFAYRAQVLQRTVFWLQMLWEQAASSPGDVPQNGLRQTMRNVWQKVRNANSYTFSWFLDILAGYGYKPGRSLFIYLLMIAAFATAYLLLGHLTLQEAIIFSVTSFHGRGFLPAPFALGSIVTALAAIEAVAGLFIEISFIATFTQRFFGR